MENVTQPRWQDVPTLTGRRMPLPPAAGTVEIQFRSDVATADPAVCRIIILEPSAAAAQVTSGTHAEVSVGHVGTWSSRFGFTEDEEPTWEDAAWQ